MVHVVSDVHAALGITGYGRGDVEVPIVFSRTVLIRATDEQLRRAASLERHAHHGVKAVPGVAVTAQVQPLAVRAERRAGGSNRERYAIKVHHSRNSRERNFRSVKRKPAGRAVGGETIQTKVGKGDAAAADRHR